MSDQQEQSEFAERAAAALRAPERADEHFADRVMAAVHAARHEAGLPWWRRHWTFTLTPVSALALAAGMVLLWLSAGAVRERPAPAGPADTVHVVRFVLVDSTAREVMLVGSFNGWAAGAMPLAHDPERGVWSVSIPLASGRHEYAFMVRDERGVHWLADPFAPQLRDDFGTESSIVFLGS